MAKRKKANGVLQHMMLAAYETKMDEVLAQLDAVNKRLRAKPRRKVNTRDLPKLELVALEK